MVQEYPDGTIICFYGATAEIGGWNGADYLIVNRSDGGPDVFSSNFTVGACEEETKIPWLLLGAALIGLYLYMRR
jgi:hypothetical protein